MPAPVAAPAARLCHSGKKRGGGSSVGVRAALLLGQDHDYWRCGEAEVRAPAARTAVRRNRHGGRAMASSKNFLPDVTGLRLLHLLDLPSFLHA